MLVCLDVPTMAGPEAYIGHAGKLFNEAGELTNDSSREFFTRFMASFERWVARNAG
jgi:chromate reductase